MKLVRKTREYCLKCKKQLPKEVENCTNSACVFHALRLYEVCEGEPEWKQRTWQCVDTPIKEEPTINKYEQVTELGAAEDIEEVEEVEPVKAKTVKAYTRKTCAVCGNYFVPKSNRAKYCKKCSHKMHNKQTANSVRKARAKKRAHS